MFQVFISDCSLFSDFTAHCPMYSTCRNITFNLLWFIYNTEQLCKTFTVITHYCLTALRCTELVLFFSQPIMDT